MGMTPVWERGQMAGAITCAGNVVQTSPPSNICIIPVEQVRFFAQQLMQLLCQGGIGVRGGVFRPVWHGPTHTIVGLTS